MTKNRITNALRQKGYGKIKGGAGKIAERGSDELLANIEKTARNLREKDEKDNSNPFVLTADIFEQIKENIKEWKVKIPEETREILAKEFTELGEEEINKISYFFESDFEKAKKLNQRKSPEFVDKMYSDLKKKIDAINKVPANKKYLEEFEKMNERIKRIYTRRKGEEVNAIELLKDGLYNLNISTKTGRAKTIKIDKREVDYNDADIDGRGIYILMDELGMIKDEGAEDQLVNSLLKNDQAKGRKAGLKVNYLQSKEETTERTTREGLSINERQVGEDDGIKIKKGPELHKKNIFENPFKNIIVEINNNLKHSDGPTSSTRMVYEMLKSAGIIENLPKEKQIHIEKFVYFVDMAYRLKQRIVGMDFEYINSTIFGNYKQLNINDIYDYLGEEGKTGFEYITPEEAKKMPIFKGTRRGKIKKYTDMQLEDLFKQKEGKLNHSEKSGKGILNNSLVYKPKNKTYKEQEFIFDINKNIPNADDFAIYLASQKKGFCKLHEKTNEVYMRSYYDLPKRFGPFLTESGNTIHTKLTEENIDEFLDIFEGENRLEKEYGDVKVGQELEVKITKVEGKGKDRKVSLERTTIEDADTEKNEIVEKTDEVTKESEETNITNEIISGEQTEAIEETNIATEKTNEEETKVTEEKTDKAIEEPEEDLVVGKKIVGVVTEKKEGVGISVQIGKDNITGLIHVPSIKKQLKDQFYINLKKQKNQQRLEAADELIKKLPILYKDDLVQLKEGKEINKEGKKMKGAIEGIVVNKHDKHGIFVQIAVNNQTGLIYMGKIKKEYEGIGIGEKIKVKIISVKGEEGDLEIGLDPVLEEKQEVELPELRGKDVFVGNKMIGVVKKKIAGTGIIIQIGKHHDGLIYMPEKSQAELDKFESGERIKVGIKEIRSGGKVSLEIIELPKLKKSSIEVGKEFDGMAINGVIGVGVFVQIGIDRRDSGLIHMPRASQAELDALLKQKRVRVKIKKVDDKGIGFEIITSNPKSSSNPKSGAPRVEKKELPKVGEEALKIGAQFTGRIKNKVAFGIFVDIGGIDGLIHITKLGQDAYSKAQPGQEANVEIIGVEKKEGKTLIRLKPISSSPKVELSEQEKIESPKSEKKVELPKPKAVELPKLEKETLKRGMEFEGKIIEKKPNGIVVEIGQEIFGLVHITKLSRDTYNKLQLEQTIKVKIIEIRKGGEIGLETTK